MSYILEALRKAEQERNLGQVPDLETVCAPPSSPRRRLWPWLVLALALLINATALVWIFSPWSATTHPIHRHLTVAARTPAASATTPATAPAFLPLTPATQALPPEPMANPLEAEPTQETPSPPPASPQSVPTADPRPAITQTAMKDNTAVNGSTVTTLPPLLYDLPTKFSHSLPKLNLDIHVYNEAKSASFVMINSKRYREGEQLSEGPLLEAIVADGAVLRHRGQRFLLPLYH